MEPRGAPRPLPRYVPGRGFPSYAFLPGKNPHPTSDPSGHSFGREEVPAPYFPARSWRCNEAYLFGIDLYNHGYLWESHESLEGIWHTAKHDAAQAEFLQGLIQCAAACLKVRMQQPRGLARLTDLGSAHLRHVARAVGPRFMGLDLDEVSDAFVRFAGSSPKDAEGRPRIELA